MISSKRTKRAVITMTKMRTTMTTIKMTRTMKKTKMKTKMTPTARRARAALSRLNLHPQRSNKTFKSNGKESTRMRLKLSTKEMRIKWSCWRRRLSTYRTKEACPSRIFWNPL